jgi:hypothetical protein
MTGLHVPLEAHTGVRLMIKVQFPHGNGMTSAEFPAAYVVNDRDSCRNMIAALHSAGLVEHPKAVQDAHAQAYAREGKLLKRLETVKRKASILRRILDMRDSGSLPIPGP